MSVSRKVRALLALVCTTLVSVSCATQPTLRERLKHYPAKHLAFYDFDPSTPLIDRVGTAPRELLDLYSGGEQVKPQPVELTPKQLQQLGDVLAMLPKHQQDVLKRRLVGIYCVDNFAGSGMADWALGAEDEVYFILILHPRVFQLTAAELLTFRANTAFRQDDPSIRLRIALSPRISGLAYIVLHEATHVVDYAARYTPYVDPAMLTLFGRSVRDTTFTDKVWSDYQELAPSVEFAYRKRLRFYGLGGGPELSSADIEPVYDALASTPFTSLYASTNWADDFAEFVTFNYLVRTLGVHYVIRVERTGRPAREYSPMASPAVAVRSKFIDPDLFRRPGNGSTKRAGVGCKPATRIRQRTCQAETEGEVDPGVRPFP